MIGHLSLSHPKGLGFQNRRVISILCYSTTGLLSPACARSLSLVGEQLTLPPSGLKSRVSFWLPRVCGFRATAAAAHGNLLEMQALRLSLKFAELEPLGAEPGSLCFFYFLFLKTHQGILKPANVWEPPASGINYKLPVLRKLALLWSPPASPHSPSLFPALHFTS